MPIYVYEPTIFSLEEECNDCCYFEVIQSFKDEPLKICPTCQHPVHRAVTSFYVGSKESLPNVQNSQTKESSSPSSARKAARMATQHVCRSGCSH